MIARLQQTRNIPERQNSCAVIGFHVFDPLQMLFFRGRVATILYKDCFISSEESVHHGVLNAAIRVYSAENACLDAELPQDRIEIRVEEAAVAILVHNKI